MKKKWFIIILGTAHRLREPGKLSPDGRLKECVYSREITVRVKNKLEEKGYRVLIDYEDLDLPKSMQSPRNKLELQRELGMRVNFVNEVCRQNGTQNVIYVSIHVDASGKDGKWHGPNGWSVRVSPMASNRSRKLADSLYDVALNEGLNTRFPSPKQKYWEQSLKVLNDTNCPAVLTENLFQDNIDDVAFLLSEEGKDVIERIHVNGIINFIESL